MVFLGKFWEISLNFFFFLDPTGRLFLDISTAVSVIEYSIHPEEIKEACSLLHSAIDSFTTFFGMIGTALPRMLSMPAWKKLGKIRKKIEKFSKKF